MNDTTIVEIGLGSTSSRSRPIDQRWLVRLRHGPRHTVLAIGLTRTAAEHLAADIRWVLDPDGAAMA